MQSALRVHTPVLPGHRIELCSPQLPEGDTVEVIVVLPEPAGTGRRSAVDLLRSLPPGPRSAKTWDELERAFQEERNSWDR
jgi:hypothetical protein